jgi:hypothetical protein
MRPTFEVLSVQSDAPEPLPINLRKYGLDVQPDGRITYYFLGSNSCRNTEGPSAMPLANPHRVIFEVRPRGCTDDQARLTAVVKVSGIKLDLTRDFVLELRLPKPFGRVELTQPAR